MIRAERRSLGERGGRAFLVVVQLRVERLVERHPDHVQRHDRGAALLRESGIEDADAVVVATDGDNTNIIIGQVAQKRFDVRCVVVRVLDPARAKFYAERGLDTVCPTSIAIDRLMDAARTCAIPTAQPTDEAPTPEPV